MGAESAHTPAGTTVLHPYQVWKVALEAERESCGPEVWLSAL